MTLRIFPATDLHLLNGTSVPLRIFSHLGEVWSDLGRLGIKIRFDPMPAFVSVAGLTVTATGVGSTVTRIILTDSTNSDIASAPMRIATHRELRKLFLPRTALELETDRSDRVLTVYGEFQAADGSVVTGDVTAHPYLKYTVNVKSGSPTLSVRSGRVLSGNAAGGVEIQVGVDPALSQPAPAVPMTVTIVAAITDRPILKQFHTGTSSRKKSILFVPDGFTAAQQVEFETLAGNIGRKLLQAISPYRHLRESFDLYTAFVPSAEEGITIGPPIIARPGSANVGFSLPLDKEIQTGAGLLDKHMLVHLGHPATSAAQTLAAARAQLQASLIASTGQQVVITARELPQTLYDLWQSLRTQPPQSRVRETFFGTMIGERHQGTEAFKQDIPTPAKPALDAAIYMARGEVRSPIFDERRVPDLTSIDPKKAHIDGLSRFVRTLRIAGGTVGLGKIWAGLAADGTPAGDSFGLVVIIARADHYAGVEQEGCLLLSIGPGIIHRTTASTLVPRLLEVVPVPRPITAADTKLGFVDRPVDSLMDVVAHELAHSVALGSFADEYGGRGGPPTDVVGISFAENAPNAQLIANSRAGAGPGLDVTRIKWNWERVDGAARVDTIKVNGAEIEIGVSVEDAGRWPVLTAGRLLTLRSGNLAVPAPGSTQVGSTAANPAPQSLNLISFDAAARKLRCSVLGTTPPAQVVTTFPSGSVIYVPKLFAGATVRIIPGALGARLSASGPFSPSGAGCNPVAPVPPNVPGFVWPAVRLRAVAAYEVGASFNCGVIRPAGECKMRNVVDEPNELPTDFCYVCKYAMAYMIDPGVLPAIDREYP